MKKKSGFLKAYIYASLCLVIGIGVDQFTKYLAVKHLKNQESFVIIKGVFQLHYLENRGAAFGLLQNKVIFFVLGALLVTGLLAYCYGKFPLTRRFLPIRICMVVGCAGALGNLIDRITHKYVIDFFYFEWIDFPIFNVADIYVVVACFVFLLLILFYYKEADFEYLFPNKTKKTEK